MRKAKVEISLKEWIEDFPCLYNKDWRPDDSWKWWDEQGAE